MKQENIRKGIRNLHDNLGVTYSYTAKKLGVSYAFLSMFLHNKRNLGINTELKADKYLDSYKWFLENRKEDIENVK